MSSNNLQSKNGESVSRGDQTDSTVDVLVREARRRGIEAAVWPDVAPGTFQLQLAEHRELLYYSSTDRHGHVTHKMCDNKALTSELLRAGGFPLAEEIITADWKQVCAFLQTWKKVVLKPLGNTGGKGVTPNIQSEDLLREAFELAQQTSLLELTPQPVVCQRHMEGKDYRVLVVGGEHIFVIERVSARVVGDGRQTIAALVKEYNQVRKPECRAQLGRREILLLEEQGHTLESVPQVGEVVRVSPVANYHAGGRLHDATDQLADAVRSMALRLAAHFSLPIVGIDIISPDIQAEVGVIIELNSTPDLTIHHYPDEGTGRNVAAHVIDMLFPETKAG